MACPTCKKPDVPETCGSRLGEACKCCGMTIIATADSQEVIPDENYHQEGPEGSDNNNSS